MLGMKTYSQLKSGNIFSYDAKACHSYACVEHRNQIVRVLVRSSLELLSFSSVEPLVVIDSLTFEGFYLILELDSFLLLFLLLLVRPV